MQLPSCDDKLSMKISYPRTPSDIHIELAECYRSSGLGRELKNYVLADVVVVIGNVRNAAVTFMTH